MKFYKLIIATIFLQLSLFAFSQSGLDNPISKAIMKVYEQQLEEDPQDYETYFKRAIEYYNHNQYAKALSDIDNALKYIPKGETDIKFQSLCMRASIYEMTEEYNKALIDLNEAYSLDPSSYTVIYRKANAEYLTNDYANAKLDYQRLLSINSRSVEAYIGLSRIAVIDKNLALANEYADNAVALAPSEADVYIRRASIRKMIGNNTGAVDDLILALSTGKNNTKALYELVEMGKTDYNAVISGLSNAIYQAPNVGMYYYIRGIIASAHYNYVVALADFKKIIHDNLYNYHGLYSEVAKCQYALGSYDEAIYNINFAINSTPENCEYYVIKSTILRALGRSAEALECSNTALEKKPNFTPAIVSKGLCLCDLCDYEQALVIFGEATLNDANNPLYYMLRAEILEKYMKQETAANAIYERVINLNYEENDVKSLKGFALLALDRYDEASLWMSNILKNNTDNNGLINYYGACFYAQAGDSDLAFECMKKSLQNGYANYYQWTCDSDANINVAPIREDPRFKEILTQYGSIFK